MSRQLWDSQLCREAAAIVVGGPYYDDSSTTMKDGSLYRMWWCGGVAGDFILVPRELHEP